MLSGLPSVHTRCVALALFVFSALSLTWGTSPAVAVLPQLPLTYIDTSTLPITTGTTWSVGAGGDFQAALNAAQRGDMIVLQAGAVFQGPFTLPNKTSGTGWITVRTSTPDSSLPPGTRVTPQQAPLMAKILGSGSPVIAIQTATAAHHYWFIGLEITASAFSHGLVQIGTGLETNGNDLPSFIYVDRSYVHGSPTLGGRRGITLNGKSQAVIDSYVSDWKEVGADSQALWGAYGPGPFKIVNNYLEAAGENVMFGGSAPTITNLVPSDIEIRRNHFFKPLFWKPGYPSYDGSNWSIKNLLELKNARRVLIDGNLLENVWIGQQLGFAVVFTPRNENGLATWSAVQDVTFQNNIVRHASSGIFILGSDAPNTSQPLQRVAITNNLFYDIASVPWGGNGVLLEIIMQSATAPQDIFYEHNTGIANFQTVFLSGGGSVIAGGLLTYRNNLVAMAVGGIGGDGTNPGNAAIAAYAPGSVFSSNAFIDNIGYGGWPPTSSYPATSLFPASMNAVGFVDWPNANYQLTGGSPYHNAATDGKDIGVDFAALAAAFSSLASPSSLRVGQ